MNKLYLIKIGEIALKGKNKIFFEKRLKKNIKYGLKGISCTVSGGKGRFFVETSDEYAEVVNKVLSGTFGIKGFSEVVRLKKDIGDITTESVRIAEGMKNSGSGLRFKIQSRRADKSFPMNSYAIVCHVGAEVSRALPELIVDVREPDWIINIELRETAYIYCAVKKGPGGLPVGTAGKGSLLLSGGIDSPVAGYMMAKRGLKLDAIYFHTYPYTSDNARQKVIDLAARLASFTCGMNLYIIPFTDVQLKIKEKGPEKAVTLLMRHAMVKIADKITRGNGGVAIVSGESLSQVASQTPESIRFTGSATDFPVFRPCIGMDKEEIISTAEKIGTFRTSILPYEDCCTLFAPEHPLTHPDFETMKSEYAALELDKMTDEAAANAEIIYLDGAEK